jgi:hypothetical protein
MQHLNKGQNVIISTDGKKAFDKIQHSFMIKSNEQTKNRRDYLNIIKTIYNKPIINIALNGEKLKPFSLKSGARQGCPLFPLLSNLVLGLLSAAISQK